MMTGEQYIKSIAQLKMKIFCMGKEFTTAVEHPILQPSLNSVKFTYDLANDPQYRELMTATSHLDGKTINRFTHIHQSCEDLISKVKMQRLLGQKTASCFQRCVGMDAINAVYSTTYDIDQNCGTSYHARFKNFLSHCQERDLTIDGAMTDPKGNRSLPPHCQPDPDLYLRVVERNSDGIVVCGAKAHQTGICNSHEILVMPTISLDPDDKDYAVSFAIPTDTEGISIIIGRQSCDTRKLEDSCLDCGNCHFGGVEGLTVFEHVFVPNNRIFMNGETPYSGLLVERFAGYHRQSYGGCKAGVGDVLIGAAALAAESNDVAEASHIKDKLIEMLHLNETLYACGIACSCEGHPTRSGNYDINTLLANVCKQNVTRFPYEIARLAQDIAGGLMVTAPSEKDLDHPVAGPLIEKYLSASDSFTVRERIKLLRLIENLTLGTAAVGYLTESMHGAGSPQAQRIMIKRQGQLAKKKQYASDILNA